MPMRWFGASTHAKTRRNIAAISQTQIAISLRHDSRFRTLA
jgi:hypothetical protein